jgi:hypothetical protein
MLNLVVAGDTGAGRRYAVPSSSFRTPAHERVSRIGNTDTKKRSPVRSAAGKRVTLPGAARRAGVEHQDTKGERSAAAKGADAAVTPIRNTLFTACGRQPYNPCSPVSRPPRHLARAGRGGGVGRRTCRKTLTQRNAEATWMTAVRLTRNRKRRQRCRYCFFEGEVGYSRAPCTGHPALRYGANYKALRRSLSRHDRKKPDKRGRAARGRRAARPAGCYPA